jgi:hypothetical protein
MGTIYTYGDDARDGFPDRLQEWGSSGPCDNGQLGRAQPVRAISQACAVLAARLKCDLPSIALNWSRSYASGDEAITIARVSREAYTEYCQVWGFARISGATTPGDVDIELDLSSATEATPTTVALGFPDNDVVVFFSFAPHVIGAGDKNDLGEEQIDMEIRWTSVSTGATITIMSISFELLAMDEIEQ